MIIISVVHGFDGRFPTRSKRDLFRWRSLNPLIGTQQHYEMQRVSVLLAGDIRLEQTKGLMHFLVFGRMGGRAMSPNSRNRFNCVSEINGEWVGKKMLCLAQIINEVHNHPYCLDEWKTKYGVHCNVGISSDKEGGLIAILGHVQKKDFESNQQLHCDGCLVRGCNNAQEDNICIVIGR